MFKRECVYLLFQVTPVTRLFLPPLPPSQRSAPCGRGPPSGGPAFAKGWTRPPPPIQPRALRGKLRQYAKHSRDVSYHWLAQRRRALGWQGNSLSILSETQDGSCVPTRDDWLPWRKTSASAVITVEPPGWSLDHHSGEDNEGTVLPLPHKAAIAVLFPKHL